MELIRLGYKKNTFLETELFETKQYFTSKTSDQNINNSMPNARPWAVTLAGGVTIAASSQYYCIEILFTVVNFNFLEEL